MAQMAHILRVLHCLQFLVSVSGALGDFCSLGLCSIIPMRYKKALNECFPNESETTEGFLQLRLQGKRF